MTTLASRELLLKAIERPEQLVPLPELGEGVSVKVTGMTARERSKFDQTLTNRAGERSLKRMSEARERLVVATCRDEAGNLLFTTEDVAQLGRQSVAVIERIVAAAQVLCGMSDADLDDAVKNSDETQDG